MGVDVLVVESLPQALDDQITVEPLATNDPVSAVDMDGKPGVLGWNFALEPGAERTLAFGYRIDWPEGRQVVLGRR